MRYPIYIPSRDRHAPDRALTVKALLRDAVPFRLVVVPSQVAAYSQLLHELGDPDPAGRLLALPDDDHVLRDSRNWIRDHAESEGHARHWQLDDNIIEFRRLFHGRRIPCDPALALGACEDFTDRYSNVAISGLNYQMFVTASTKAPFYLNVHVYSCTLVNHAWPGRWRLVYNDDTDLCLQALADGWCTVLLNAYMANKMRTMRVQGGNTNQLYEGDGRLVMAQALERAWPGVVEVTRRFGRPQHVIDWRRFTTPLKRREDVDFAALPKADEGGQKLRAVAEVRSATLRQLHEEGTAPDAA